jgi:hypothetical protein
MIYPSQQDAPLGSTLFGGDLVEVVDPSHPLYGLTLPLIGITQKRASVVMCAVWLQPGIERLIAVAATDRGAAQVGRTRCRLSIASSGALLAVVASLPKSVWDHGGVGGEASTSRARRRRPRSGAGIGVERAGRGQREQTDASKPGMVEPVAERPTRRPKPAGSDLPGDRR